MDDMATTCCVQLSKREKYLEKLASRLVLFSYILPFKKIEATPILKLAKKAVISFEQADENSQLYRISHSSFMIRARYPGICCKCFFDHAP